MRVLVCGLLRFPEGDAGSIRQKKLADMIQKLGHEVMVVGLGACTHKKTLDFRGTPYVSLRSKNDSVFGKVQSHLEYWRGLKGIMNSFKPDAVLMDDIGVLRTMRIKGYCKRRKIDLIHDSVEWYSPEQFAHGRFSLVYTSKNLLNACLIDQSCKVIAISKYLEEHFLRRGVKKCVRIPIVVSEQDFCEKKELKPNAVTFTYAGQPGRKDYLRMIVDAFADLHAKELEKVRVNIIGCTEEQLYINDKDTVIPDKLKGRMTFHGYIPHDSVLRILEETDFTVLMRDPTKRYAKAGFPTKMVESLSRSTPIICNLSSDMGDYLKDGENALIVEDCDLQSLERQIRRAIEMSYEDRVAMAQKALQSARESFDMLQYLSKVEEILEV